MNNQEGSLRLHLHPAPFHMHIDGGMFNPYSLKAVLSLLFDAPRLNTGESLRYCCFKNKFLCCSKSRRLLKDVKRKKTLASDASFGFNSRSDENLFYLVAQSNCSVCESFPFPFKSSPLMSQLCPGHLKTFPLFQKVRI